MMRRFLLAVAVVGCTFTFAFSDTFQARITKVEGDKVTYQKGTLDPDTKKVKYGDAVTATVAKDAKVTKTVKKATEPVDKGFGNDLFTKIDAAKGVKGLVTIADDGADKGKITEFVIGGKKAPK